MCGLTSHETSLEVERSVFIHILQSDFLSSLAMLGVFSTYLQKQNSGNQQLLPRRRNSLRTLGVTCKMFEVAPSSSQILIQLLSALCVCKLMSFCALWDFRTLPNGVISHVVHGLAPSVVGLVPPCWSSHNSFLCLPSALNYSSFFQALSTSLPQPVPQM